jgi:sulfite reductase beta subunit-like hemoprotein
VLYREIIAVCSEIHTKHINTLCGQNVEFVNVKLGGKYSDHWALEGYISLTKTSQLMLYREIIAVCSQIHTKHINTLCGQNVDFFNVNLGGKYSDHWALQDRFI